MTAEQIVSQLQGYIRDLGQPHHGGGRKQMFWRAALKTGLPSARLTTLFYNKGACPSAYEYLIIKQRWMQLRLDRETMQISAKLAETRNAVEGSIANRRGPSSSNHQQSPDQSIRLPL